MGINDEADTKRKCGAAGVKHHEPKVYMVGAHVQEVVSATIPSKTFPKVPAGSRIAERSPPMLLPPSKPACQAGTPGAAAARAAPSICHAICTRIDRQ
jgi:hypothetical protein